MEKRNLALKRAARIFYKLRMYVVSDKNYCVNYFKKEKGQKPNLDDPQTLSEKLLYLMLHYRNPLETLCADKYYVQEYLKACGLEYIMKPILKVYKSANDIKFDELPDEFFIKCNHLSGNNMVVRKKDNPDYNYIRDFYKEVLKLDYYTRGREYQYHHIRPLILCEPCLRDSQGNLPIDYKFYCFNGEPKYWMISLGEYEHKVRNHKFDMNCNSVDYHFKSKPTLEEKDAVIPENIEEMFSVVKTLCKPFPHVRVDLYNIDGKIYFGELTFTTNGGVINVSDPEYDKEIGSWIDLDKYKVNMI